VASTDSPNAKIQEKELYCEICRKKSFSEKLNILSQSGLSWLELVQHKPSGTLWSPFLPRQGNNFWLMKEAGFAGAFPIF